MDIYQYDDFRLYLKDAFGKKKAEDKKYSHRKFAADAGIKNPGFLNDVIKGFKPLGEKAATGMAQALTLRANERDFFLLLVKFGQAKSEETKSDLYKKIVQRRNHSSFIRLNQDKSRYYQDYRYSLVRGAIEVTRFKGNYEELAKFLVPPLNVNAVKKIVQDLCEWGFVTQKPSGEYVTSSAITEPAPTMLHLSRMMNSEWLKNAREALARFPREQRYVSTAVLNISEGLEKEVWDLIEDFRDKIFKLVEKDKSPEKVLQLTIAFVPNSKKKSKP